ncbi:MAG TPA: ABC transporter transmembrane domain-containing protein [Chthonomonadaceae bacterium]|nr:ABC transporter transmembrane domain-containing protein [Chthonomonadaceae bacterium]
MALLDALPEEVEQSLRDLRAQEDSEDDGDAIASAEQNGHSAAPVEAANGDSTEATGGDEAAQQEPQRIALATDINSQGVFGPEWLVVEGKHVYVFSPSESGNGHGNGKNGHVHLRQTVPLRKIKEAKAEMLVGNGLLEVRTDTETIPLVRFSQAVVAEANTVARQLNAIAKGEPVPEANIKDRKKYCPRCKRVLPEDTEVCPACVNKRAVMLRLFRFLAPYKLQAIASVLILIGATLADIAPPYIGGRIVDAVVRPRYAGIHAAMVPVIEWVVVLLLIRLGMAVLTYCQRRLNPWLGARILMDIRVSLYEKFNLLSLAYYDKRNIGSVMSRVTNDADNLWDFLSDGAPWLITNVMTLVGIGAVLFRMNWQLALLVLIPTPFLYALTSWFMPRARQKWRHVWHRISKMYAVLGSTLNGMRVVKAFAQEDREIKHFRDRNYQVFMSSYLANSFWATYWPLVGLLMSSGSYIIWLFGGYKVLNHAMTIGTLTAFNAYMWQFYAPFQNFSRVLDWSTRSLTAAERVFEVLDTEPDIKEAPHAVPMPDIKGEVEFEKVGFSYDKARRVLDDFTLKVEPGEMIGLVGHSGAGKSTIINLLARFYDVDDGDIKVDGVDIRNIHQEDFRHQLGIVLQEPFLFPGTIRDNIAYAKPGASVEEIMRAAKAANCHEFIMKFPDGYDTQVGERGQRLSGGERQRISIARAILHDPKILILDEATASVDTETEKQIQEAIARLIQNRTTFAIAHRLSTLRHASRLVVMKEGKMVELGTHDELMALDGVYANLVKIQTEVNQIRAV